MEYTLRLGILSISRKTYLDENFQNFIHPLCSYHLKRDIIILAILISAKRISLIPLTSKNIKTNKTHLYLI